MKRLLCLSVGLIFLACGTANGPGTTDVPPPPSSPHRTGEDQIELDCGQSVAIGHDGMRVLFAAVEQDSRCPTNVQCPWAGNGRIRLDLVDSHERVTPVLLNTMMGQRGTVVLGLRIDLLELRPSPDKPQSLPQEAYSVLLSVTEQ